MTEIKRPVFFSGENPAMTLYDLERETVQVIASFWLCSDGPHGPGQALVLWCSDPALPSAIYTPNPALAQALVHNLVRHFPEFEGCPVENLPYRPAALQHHFDGNCYTVLCQAGEDALKLEWIEPLDCKQLLWPGFPAGDATYDLSTVLRPCRTGRLTVNGEISPAQAATGQNAEGRLSSSAFLAFAETWVGPLPQAGE